METKTACHNFTTSMKQQYFLRYIDLTWRKFSEQSKYSLKNSQQERSMKCRLSNQSLIIPMHDIWLADTKCHTYYCFILPSMDHFTDTDFHWITSWLLQTHWPTKARLVLTRRNHIYNKMIWKRSSFTETWSWKWGKLPFNQFNPRTGGKNIAAEAVSNNMLII